MIKIHEFRIDHDKVVGNAAFVGAQYDNWRAIRELTKLDRVGDAFVSEPMATTEPRYLVIEEYLRSMFGDWLGWGISNLTGGYHLIRTQAPLNYDYGYCIEIATTVVPGEKSERLVAIPVKSVEYQVARYGSGMYTAVDCSNLSLK